MQTKSHMEYLGKDNYASMCIPYGANTLSCQLGFHSDRFLYQLRHQTDIYFCFFALFLSQWEYLLFVFDLKWRL